MTKSEILLLTYILTPPHHLIILPTIHPIYPLILYITHFATYSHASTLTTTPSTTIVSSYTLQALTITTISYSPSPPASPQNTPYYTPNILPNTIYHPFCNLPPLFNTNRYFWNHYCTFLYITKTNYYCHTIYSPSPYITSKYPRIHPLYICFYTFVCICNVCIYISLQYIRTYTLHTYIHKYTYIYIQYIHTRKLTYHPSINPYYTSTVYIYVCIYLWFV